MILENSRKVRKGSILTLHKILSFLPDSRSGKLLMITRPNHISQDQKYDNIKQQKMINSSSQESF